MTPCNFYPTFPDQCPAGQLRGAAVACQCRASGTKLQQLTARTGRTKQAPPVNGQLRAHSLHRQGFTPDGLEPGSRSVGGNGTYRGGSNFARRAVDFLVEVLIPLGAAQLTPGTQFRNDAWRPQYVVP